MKRTIYLLSLIFTAGVAQAAPPNLVSADAHAYFNQVRQKVGMMELSPRWLLETTDTVDSSLLDPFVNTNWQFATSYSDEDGDFLVSYYVFDTSPMALEDGTVTLVATEDTGWIWVLWYDDTDSSYVLGADVGNGEFSTYSFNCDTPACDSTVTGVFETLYSDGSVSEPLEFTGQRIDDAAIVEASTTEESPTENSDDNSDFVESPPSDELPQLGDTIATDATGKVMWNQAVFSGGIAINGGKEYQTQMTQSLYDEVDILGEMIVDPNHVGQEADIFVYAETTLPPLEGVFYFMLDEGLKAILPWDQNPVNLVAFIPGVRLNALETVTMYQGTFYYSGTLKVHFGYRLADGTVVTSGEPIDIAIN